MKSAIYTLFIYVITSAFLTSCDGFEVSDNGNLDGMWKLTQVDTLFYGGASKTADFTYRDVFWCVQDNLLTTEMKNKTEIFIFRFKHEAGKLTISEPWHFKWRIEPDEKVEDPATLAPMGVNKLEETFEVETLNRKQMILYGEKLRLVFRRF